MQVTGNDEQQVITIHDRASVIHHQHAVAIAIKSDAQVRMLSQHSSLQLLHVGGTAVVVDVQAVGLSRQHGDLCAQLLEDARRHLVGRPMGAIDNNLQACKIGAARDAAFTEFDIAA